MEGFETHDTSIIHYVAKNRHFHVISRVIREIVTEYGIGKDDFPLLQEHHEFINILYSVSLPKYVMSYLSCVFSLPKHCIPFDHLLGDVPSN